MLSGRELRKKFIEFNREYFDDRLPPYAIRVVNRLTHVRRIDEDKVAGRCIRKRRLIKILREQSDEEAICTLVHEMAHAATPNERTPGGHGPIWAREMIRLREAGAPLTGMDRLIRLEHYKKTRVTKRMFRTHVEDILCDDSVEITLSIAIQEFMLNGASGGARSVAKFKKKFPWAGAVFKETKREFAELCRPESV